MRKALKNADKLLTRQPEIYYQLPMYAYPRGNKWTDLFFCRLIKFISCSSFFPPYTWSRTSNTGNWLKSWFRAWFSKFWVLNGSLERAILGCCPLTRVRHSSHSLMLDLANVLCQISFSDRTLKWFVDPPGIKPKTFHLFVKYVNHYTTEPLSHITQRGRKKKCISHF